MPPGATVTLTARSWSPTRTPGSTTSLTPPPGHRAGQQLPGLGADPPVPDVVNVLIPGLTITETASSSTTTPGSLVRYTITVADTGQTSYAGAVVTNDLTGVLNDVAYNGDATATTGTVSYASPVLTWAGDLAPGDTATVTYSVTVDNPDNGDRHPVSTAVSTAQGSTCPPGGTSPACTAVVDVLIPGLTITKTADVASAAPGSAVGYTITVADTGQTSYAGAVVTDDLTGVLRRRGLQRRRHGHHGHRLLRQPGPHLDGRPRAR